MYNRNCKTCINAMNVTYLHDIIIMKQTLECMTLQLTLLIKP